MIFGNSIPLEAAYEPSDPSFKTKNEESEVTTSISSSYYIISFNTVVKLDAKVTTKQKHTNIFLLKVRRHTNAGSAELQ